MRPFVWQVISDTNGDVDAIAALAREATSEQLILLYGRWMDAMWDLLESDKFCRHLKTDEQEMAAWVVSQGQRFALQIEQDPSGLPAEVPAGTPDYLALLKSVYTEKFGHPMPLKEDEPTVLDGGADWVAKLESLPDLLELGVPLHQLLAGYTRSELVWLHTATSKVDFDASAIQMGLKRDYMTRYLSQMPLPA